MMRKFNLLGSYFSKKNKSVYRSFPMCAGAKVIKKGGEINNKV